MGEVIDVEVIDKEMVPEIEYVGFWLRVAAAIIDTIWLMIIIVPILWMAYGLDYWTSDKYGMVAGPVDVLAQWVFPAVVSIGFWLALQATPGKMFVGAKIVDAASLGKLTPGQAVLRYLGYFVSVIPLLLGIIWVGFDAKKQGWHDKIAGTLVIKARK